MKKKTDLNDRSFSSGDRTRTYDLRVMSPKNKPENQRFRGFIFAKSIILVTKVDNLLPSFVTRVERAIRPQEDSVKWNVSLKLKANFSNR